MTPVGKGAKWLIGIAAVVVVGGIINLVDGGNNNADTAVPLVATSSQTQTTTSSAESSAPSTSASLSPSLSTSTSAAPVTTSVEQSEAPLPAPAAIEPISQAIEADPVVTVLATLPVKGRAPHTGYDRALFGQAWTDDVTVEGGHNGCDTRNDVLRRDLTDIVIKPGSNGCTVLSGTLQDPYSGKTIAFTRGEDTSPSVQIDHVVAMSDAWQTGAQQLSPEQRRDFANDPINLQATDGPTNSTKQDGDAATWLPPAKDYRCTYVSRQVEVKARYDLWVTQAEHDAILRVLASCGATVPDSTAVKTTASAAAVVTTKAAATSSNAAPSKTSTASPKTTKAAPQTSAAPPPPKTTAAPPVQLVDPTPAAGCHPVSAAGNCYQAGQFCAKAHHGITGTDAAGRAITCQPDGSRWRWLY